jgi:hypothetical protein
MSKLALDKSLRSSDRFGRMKVEMTNISKANVCPYLGREIHGYQALGLDANKIYKLWRHPDELAKGAHTFDMVPVLDEHIVTDAANPEKDFVAGTTGSGAKFVYPYLKVPMAFWVGDSIDEVKSRRKRELSPGYGYRPDMTPGTTPEGVAYDGVMRDIMGNHVAIVKEGRTGPNVMVADEQPQELKEFVLMKRSTVIAALAAFLKPDADQPALDAALDTQMTIAETSAATDARKAADKAAYDADPESWEDDPEKPGEKRRKAKGGAKKHMACDSAEFLAEVDKVIASRGLVPKADADKLAADAVTAALASQTALTAAREDVAPVVGAVALDSAEAVYRFALESEKVSGAKDIHVSALPALWAQVKASKDGKTSLATDGKSTDDVRVLVSAIGF